MYSGPAARGGCLSTRLKEREREREKSEITRGRGEKNAITHNHIGFLTYFLVWGFFGWICVRFLLRCVQQLEKSLREGKERDEGKPPPQIESLLMASWPQPPIFYIYIYSFFFTFRFEGPSLKSVRCYAFLAG